MPNKRADNKKQFTAAFDKDTLAKVDAEAVRRNMSRTEFLKQAALAFLKTMNEDKPNSTK